MMPGFFKYFPKDYKKKGTFKIEVIAIFFFKENVVYEEIVVGPQWKAYLKVRLQALKKDLSTQGNYYGIGWDLNEVEVS